MIYDTIINGLPVEAEYSDSFINEVALPLLRRLTELQREKDRRIIVYMAAPPGAGKTTLSEFLAGLSRENEDTTDITAIGMDGFHRYQDYLLTHDILRDGKSIRMVDVKGTPETFDLKLMTERISALTTKSTVGWPSYDRTTHNPRENAVYVNGKIVLIEGNYLLLKEKGWDKLRDFADFTIKIDADPEMLRERLLSRKIATGVTPKKAEEFVDFSDMYNVNLCLNKSAEADLKLMLKADGDYVVKSGTDTKGKTDEIHFEKRITY